MYSLSADPWGTLASRDAARVTNDRRTGSRVTGHLFISIQAFATLGLLSGVVSRPRRRPSISSFSSSPPPSFLPPSLHQHTHLHTVFLSGRARMRSNYLSVVLALATNTAALTIPFKQARGHVPVSKRSGLGSKQFNVVKAAANSDDDMNLK